MGTRLTYNIKIERDEDGIYVVSVPALTGCFTQGRTLDEAVMMAQDAIRAFVMTLMERGKRIPIEKSQVSPFAVSVNLSNFKESREVFA